MQLLFQTLHNIIYKRVVKFVPGCSVGFSSKHVF